MNIEKYATFWTNELLIFRIFENFEIPNSYFRTFWTYELLIFWIFENFEIPNF